MGANQWLDKILPWKNKERTNNDNVQATESESLALDLSHLSVPFNDDSPRSGFLYRQNLNRSKEDSGIENSDRRFYLQSLITISEDEDLDYMNKIIKAICQGDVEGFKKLLSIFPFEEVYKREISGQTLLHIICFNRNIEFLRHVLELGCDVNLLNMDGVTPLHLAVSECWTDGVQLLLEYSASTSMMPKYKLSSKWPFQELPLLTAVRNGDFLTASLLLDQNPNFSLTDSEGNTILHLACFSHCVKLVSRLLKEQVIIDNISCSNNNVNTPLHMLFIGKHLLACEEEISSCVNLILHKGAHINKKNDNGETILYLAALANLPRVVETLLLLGADPTIKNNDGKTVLHAACKSRSHESLSMLIASGKVLNFVQVEDNFGHSPFHVAVNSCSVNCCEILLQNGDHLANLDSKNRSRSSLILEHMPSAQVLLKRLFDAHIELPNKDPDDSEFRIKMDFSVFLRKSTEDVAASFISEIEDSGMDSLLKHPLIETFLYLKWRKIRPLFYIYLYSYILFSIVHTFYIIKTYGMNTDWKLERGVLTFFHIVYIITLLLLFIPRTISMFVNFKKYLTKWETLCKIIVFSTASFLVISREAGFRNMETEKIVAAISIFFTWIALMLLLSRLPSLGVYILMFTRVSRSIIGFLIAFSPLLIAFTLTFLILLSSVDAFKNFQTGIVRTLMMMIGEIDYSDIYENIKMDTTATVTISNIFLSAFLFLIPILMANLLIGLAVNDLPDLQYYGKVKNLLKKTSYLESYERLLLVCKEWPFIPSIITNALAKLGEINRKIYIYPNKRTPFQPSDPKFNRIMIKTNLIKGIIECGAVKDSEENDPNIPCYLTKKLNRYWTLKIKSTENDQETPFKKFYNDYLADQERLNSTLDSLMKMVNKDQHNSHDCKFKSRNKFRSHSTKS